MGSHRGWPAPSLNLLLEMPQKTGGVCGPAELWEEPQRGAEPWAGTCGPRDAPLHLTAPPMLMPRCPPPPPPRLVPTGILVIWLPWAWVGGVYRMGETGTCSRMDFALGSWRSFKSTRPGRMEKGSEAPESTGYKNTTSLSSWFDGTLGMGGIPQVNKYKLSYPCNRRRWKAHYVMKPYLKGASQNK